MNKNQRAVIGDNSQHRQTVYRTHSNRAHTAILNTFLQDGRISHEAKGLIAEMLSYPSDWDFTVAYIIKNGKSGRDKVYRMLKEGEKFGYIIPFKYRALDGKIQKQTYLVSDDPQALIRAVAEEIHELERLAADNPVPENPEMATPLLSNQLPGKPDTGNQEVDVPLPEKPLPVKATSGKTAYDKEIYKDKETEEHNNPPIVPPAEPEPKRPRSSVPDEYPHDFEEFWKLYPRREGKAAACKSWQRLKMPQKRRAYVSLKAQLAGLEAKLRDLRGNFCPLPATWINQGRFDDEPPPMPHAPPGHGIAPWEAENLARSKAFDEALAKVSAQTREKTNG